MAGRRRSKCARCTFGRGLPAAAAAWRISNRRFIHTRCRRAAGMPIATQLVYFANHRALGPVMLEVGSSTSALATDYRARPGASSSSSAPISKNVSKSMDFPFAAACSFWNMGLRSSRSRSLRSARLCRFLEKRFRCRGAGERAAAHTLRFTPLCHSLRVQNPKPLALQRVDTTRTHHPGCRQLELGATFSTRRAEKEAENAGLVRVPRKTAAVACTGK